MLRIALAVLRWTGGWIYYVSLVCFAGTCLGVLSHLLFALLFADQPDYAYYVSLGVTHGLKYSSLWAGGLSVVLCVMRARKEYLNSQSLTHAA